MKSFGLEIKVSSLTLKFSSYTELFYFLIFCKTTFNYKWFSDVPKSSLNFSPISSNKDSRPQTRQHCIELTRRWFLMLVNTVFKTSYAVFNIIITNYTGKNSDGKPNIEYRRHAFSSPFCNTLVDT